MILRVYALAGLLLGVPGCFSPTIANGQYRCGTEQSCPDGFVCGGDDYCYSLGTPLPDARAGGSADAGAADDRAVGASDLRPQPDVGTSADAGVHHDGARDVVVVVRDAPGNDAVAARDVAASDVVVEPDVVAPPPIAFVQAGLATTPQPAGLLSALLAPTAAHNLIVVAVTVGTTADTMIDTITDNAPGGSNVYVSANQRSHDTSCDDSAELWYAKNARAGATTVTVSVPGATLGMSMWVLEFSGLSPTAPLDVGAVLDEQASSTAIAAPEVMPSTPRALIVSTASACGTISALITGSPFTALDVQEGEDTAYYVATTSGRYAANWNATIGTWNASTVAFK